MVEKSDFASRDDLLQMVLNLEDNNLYRNLILLALCKKEKGEIDEIEKNNYINDVLGTYVFNVLMPLEDEEIRKGREKEIKKMNTSLDLIDSNRNSIPNLSNLFEGKTYYGYSVANLIKDVGWKPKPSGKNSRKAQENRLRQFIEWNTQQLEKQESITTIIAIYDEIIKKEKNKIYEPLIEVLLLSALYNTENGVITTTRNNLLKVLGVFSKYYQEIPEQYYLESIPKEFIENEDDVSKTYNVFRETTNDKLKKIIYPTLSSLQEKKKIKYYINTIIISSENKKISVRELPNQEFIITNKKLIQAENYAIEHTYYYKNNKKIYCKDWEDIIRHKKGNLFRQIYNKYISEKYGWSYTYEEIQIIAGTKQSIEKSVQKSKEKLRTIFERYFKNNAQTKYNNKLQKCQTKKEEYIAEIKDVGYTEEDYSEELKAIERKTIYLPKYFIDIFCRMVDMEICSNPELEKQYREWKKQQEILIQKNAE